MAATGRTRDRRASSPLGIQERKGQRTPMTHVIRMSLAFVTVFHSSAAFANQKFGARHHAPPISIAVRSATAHAIAISRDVGVPVGIEMRGLVIDIMAVASSTASQSSKATDRRGDRSSGSSRTGRSQKNCGRVECPRSQTEDIPISRMANQSGASQEITDRRYRSSTKYPFAFSRVLPTNSSPPGMLLCCFRLFDRSFNR